MPIKITFKVPHKVIISGEHSCVFGYPVLTTTIPLYLTITLSYHKRSRVNGVSIITGDKKDHSFSVEANHINESITEKLFKEIASHLDVINELSHFDITVEMSQTSLMSYGLGSSANFIVALFICICEITGKPFTDKDWLYSNFVFLKGLEDQFHGRSSGIDILTIIKSEFNLYVKNQDEWTIATPFKNSNNLWMLLVKSHKTKNTKASMTDLLKQLEEQREITEHKLKSIGDITKDIFSAIMEAPMNSDIHQLLNDNQKLLLELGLSDISIDRITETLDEMGIGSKLTGGGRGGCVMSLLSQSEFEKYNTIVDNRLGNLYDIYWFPLSPKTAPGIERTETKE